MVNVRKSRWTVDRKWETNCCNTKDCDLLISSFLRIYHFHVLRWFVLCASNRVTFTIETVQWCLCTDSRVMITRIILFLSSCAAALWSQTDFDFLPSSHCQPSCLPLSLPDLPPVVTASSSTLTVIPAFHKVSFPSLYLDHLDTQMLTFYFSFHPYILFM